MKEIRETKLVEQTTVRFIACDGKEFTDEKECASYERRLDKDKLEKEYKKLHPIELSLPLIDYASTCYAELINVKSEEDFDIIVDYYKSLSSWMDTCNLTDSKPTEYPKQMIIVSGEEWVCACSQTFESIRDNLMKAYKQLGGE